MRAAALPVIRSLERLRSMPAWYVESQDGQRLLEAARQEIAAARAPIAKQLEQLQIKHAQHNDEHARERRKTEERIAIATRALHSGRERLHQLDHEWRTEVHRQREERGPLHQVLQALDGLIPELLARREDEEIEVSNTSDS